MGLHSKWCIIAFALYTVIENMLGMNKEYVYWILYAQGINLHVLNILVVDNEKMTHGMVIAKYELNFVNLTQLNNYSFTLWHSTRPLGRQLTLHILDMMIEIPILLITLIFECAFPQPYESRSLQVGTPNLAYATSCSPIRDWAPKWIVVGELILKEGMLTTMGSIGMAQARTTPCVGPC